MRRLMGLAVLALLACVGAQAGTRVLEPEDIFRLHWASDPQMRVDGSEVAFVRQEFDATTDRPVHSLWIVDVATAVQRQVGTAPGQYSSPRWSPNGESLAYLRTTPDGKSTQIEVYSTRSGAAAVITDVRQVPRDLAWSPDGRFIAFVMLVPEPPLTLGTAISRPEGTAWADPLVVIRDVNFRADGKGYLPRGYMHVFVVPAAGGPARQVTEGPYSEVGPLSWSPDGAQLLLATNREKGWERDPMDASGSHPRHRNIYRVNVADGQMAPLTRRRGSLQNPAMSPDGGTIAYLGFDDQNLGYQHLHLTLTDRDGKGSHTLGDALGRSIESFSWSADGRRIFAAYTDRGVSKVAQLSLDGTTRSVAQGPSGDEIDLPYSDSGFSVAANDAVAYLRGGGDQLPEIYVSKGASTIKLTHFTDELLKSVRLGSLKALPARSSFDQRPIDAWEIRPPNFDSTRQYPLILEIHGGPYASYGPVFSLVDQLFAAAGYIVVYANPRGSTSYGEEFANLIQYHFPEHDFDDLMSVVDAAIQGGSVDPDNLFVTGGSGGGVLTAWIVGGTQRFRAAASRAPVVDWSSWVVTSDVYAYVARAWFRKLPWDDHETYWRQSPISRVGTVTTPTLMVVGDQDLRTTVGQAEQFYHGLQLINTPTELVKLPGSAHSASRPSQITAEVSAILAWFERYRHVPSS